LPPTYPLDDPHPAFWFWATEKFPLDGTVQDPFALPFGLPLLLEPVPYPDNVALTPDVAEKFQYPPFTSPELFHEQGKTMLVELDM
jgi:hypothetical protein